MDFELMLTKQIILREPEDLLLAAKEVLGWYGMKTLRMYPYSFCWTDNTFVVEKAERIIVQQNLHEGTTFHLEAADYQWFERKLRELRDVADWGWRVKHERSSADGHYSHSSSC